MKLSAGKIFLLTLLVLIIVSCGKNNTVYNQEFKIPSQTWDYDSVIRFDVEILDTINWYQVIFRIKHSENYGFANLWIKSVIMTPTNVYRIDTLNIPFQDAQQRWIGSAIGNTWTVDYVYADSVRFFKSGRYSFMIQHIMRPQKIKNIKSFGIIIKKLK